MLLNRVILKYCTEEAGKEASPAPVHHVYVYVVYVYYYYYGLQKSDT